MLSSLVMCHNIMNIFKILDFNDVLQNIGIYECFSDNCLWYVALNETPLARATHPVWHHIGKGGVLVGA